ncbi:MAG: response regulator [Lachnospiraceae bacterium]|nr:response regulator [Lachnospiraceae bacterium]
MDSGIQVLIIDDEETTREGIQRHISWKELGVYRTFLADGCALALSIMQKENIDIVISDVCMPHMNGIELCNALRKENSSVKIIFLSGYSDKEYLKGAIHLSAIEYLEKPIQIQELEECIERAVSQCLSEKTMEEKRNETIALIDTSTQIIKEQFIQQLLKGKPSQELYAHLPAETKTLMEKQTYFCCAVVRYIIHGNSSVFLDIMEEKRHLEVLFAGKILFAYVKEDSYIILFLNIEKQQDWDKEIEWPFYLYTKECESKRVTVYIAKSNMEKGSSNLTAQYQQAIISMQSCFFYRNRWEMQGKKNEDNKLAERNEALYQEFCKAIVAYERERAEECARQVYALYKKDGHELPDIVRNSFFQLNYFIYHNARKSLIKLNDSKDKNEQEFLWRRINGLETLDECYKYLSENIQAFFENADHMLSGNRSILQAIEYIRNHFMEENLSVQDIAESVYLSPTYLSTLFKQKTGKTIGQYIRIMRMEYASLLLEDRGIAISDVATKCGYTDSKYFTKVFKQHFNMIPFEYREKVLKTKEY